MTKSTTGEKEPIELSNIVGSELSPEDDKPSEKEVAEEAAEQAALEKLTAQVKKINLDKVPFLSIMFQLYLSPLIKLGGMKALTPDDIPDPRESEKAENVSNMLADDFYGAAKSNPDTNLWWTSVWTFRRPLIQGGMSDLCADVIQFLGPFVVEQIVAFFEDVHDKKDPNPWKGVMYCVLLACITISTTTTVQGRFYNISLFCIRVRIALMQLLFEKVMKVSPNAMQGRTTGQLLNLVTNDTGRFTAAGDFFTELYAAPMAIIACVIILYIRLGVVAFIAIVLLALLFPMQLIMASLVRSNRSKLVANSDRRVKLVNEMLQGIRIIKLYAWEGAVRKAIADAREIEIKTIRRGLLLRFVNVLTLFLWPSLVIYCTLTYIASEENSLTSAKVFLILSFMNVIRYSIILLPYCHQALVEVGVASKRISDFLLAEELPPPPPHMKEAAVTSQLGSIPDSSIDEQSESEREKELLAELKKTTSKQEELKIRDMLRLVRRKAYLDRREPHFIIKPTSFFWSETEPPILSDISLEVKPGELVGVIGPVGVGKSSLLQGLLGEMYYSSDSTSKQVIPNDNLGEFIGEEGAARTYPLSKFRGRVGYFSQDPWILNATLKDNILLELPYDKEKFDRVIRAACLEPDLAILADGAQTVIGEQGVNLSGGQKARVAIARMLYRAESLDVCLLDDPLSAVDVSVGRHIFNECIQGELKDKTRIVVLNSHLHTLSHFDRIIVLESSESALDAFQQVTDNHDKIVNHTLITDSNGKAVIPDSDKAKLGLNGKTELAVDLGSPSAHRQFRAPSIIRAIGTYEELLQQQIDFAKFDQNTENEDQEVQQDKEKLEEEQVAVNPACKADEDENGADSDEVELGLEDRENKESGDNESESTLRLVESPDKKDKEEDAKENKSKGAEREHGMLKLDKILGAKRIKLSQYIDYLGSGTSGLQKFSKVAFLLFAILMAQGTRTTIDLWITRWGSDSPNTPQSSNSTNWWIVSSALWIIACFIMLLLRTVASMLIASQASRVLHDVNFAAVLRAPMVWFDITPLGAIVNLFSKDCETIDLVLPESLFEFMQQVFTLLAMVVLAIAVSPVFIALFVIILVMVYYRQRQFRPVATQLKRLESAHISPVYASFSSAVRGMDSIRAYGLQEDFVKKNQEHLDRYSKFLLFFTLTQRWLAWRLDALATTFVLSVALLGVIFRHNVSPNIAALAIVNSMQMLGLLQWNVRLFIMTESYMTSVERLVDLSNLESEARYMTGPNMSEYLKLRSKRGDEEETKVNEQEGQDTRVDMLNEFNESAEQTQDTLELGTFDDINERLGNWPWRGEIKFNNVQMRYREDLPIVLNKLSFTLPPGKKLGVVGRTGAGKSTLLLVLFRLIELNEGSVTIDDVDIKTVGLGDLRTRMSIIPQQPVLFSGTVRYNLDPFGLYSDDEIQSALERVGLLEKVNSMDGALEAAVTEFGGNFSHGQRQLLCIARALLRNSRVLVLDEATAAVDPHTDAAIQATVRSCFSHCTIITIAHRLETIVDYDYVLVLGPVDSSDSSVDPSHYNSSVLEFGPPHELLENTEGVFHSMAMEGGERTFRSLLAKSKSLLGESIQ